MCSMRAAAPWGARRQGTSRCGHALHAQYAKGGCSCSRGSLGRGGNVCGSWWMYWKRLRQPGSYRQHTVKPELSAARLRTCGAWGAAEVRSAGRSVAMKGSGEQSLGQGWGASVHRGWGPRGGSSAKKSAERGRASTRPACRRAPRMRGLGQRKCGRKVQGAGAQAVRHALMKM